jgi:hypothetical protein
MASSLGMGERKREKKVPANNEIYGEIVMNLLLLVVPRLRILVCFDALPGKYINTLGAHERLPEIYSIRTGAYQIAGSDLARFIKHVFFIIRVCVCGYSAVVGKLALPDGHDSQSFYCFCFHVNTC